MEWKNQPAHFGCKTSKSFKQFAYFKPGLWMLQANFTVLESEKFSNHNSL